MGTFKYQPTGKESKLLLAFNHWLNPFGNWHEPLPYPEKRKIQADESRLPNWLWWNLRNPLHNFNHFIIGITPRGERYEWISPEENGWTRKRIENNKTNGITAYWVKKNGFPMRLPIYEFTLFSLFEGYIGWMKRGNFGIAFRKIQNK